MPNETDRDSTHNPLESSTPSTDAAPVDRPITLDARDLSAAFRLTVIAPCLMRQGNLDFLELILDSMEDSNCGKAELRIEDDSGRLLNPEKNKPRAIKVAGVASTTLQPVTLEPRAAGSLLLKFWLTLTPSNRPPVVLWTCATLTVDEASANGAPVHVHIAAPVVTRGGQELSGEDARLIGNDQSIKVNHVPVINLPAQPQAHGMGQRQRVFLSFFLDAERTEQSLLKENTRRSAAHGYDVIQRSPRRPVHANPANERSPGSALLELTTGQRTRRLIVLTGDQVHIGRGWDPVDTTGHLNDIIVVPTPYNHPKRRDREQTLSRSFGKLESTPDGILFRKNPTCQSRVRLDQRRVDPAGSLIDNHSVLAFGDMVEYRVHLFAAETAVLDDRIGACLAKAGFTNPTPKGRWRVAYFERHDTHPDKDHAPLAPFTGAGESFLWLFNEASLGSATGVAVHCEGAQPVQGWIFRRGGAYWLRAAIESDDLRIDGAPVRLHELHRLSFGHEITVGATRLRFLPYDPEALIPE